MVDRLPLSRVLILDEWPDLETRRHELPPRGSPLGVVGLPPPWLEKDYEITRLETGDGGKRLWTVNPVLARIVTSSSKSGSVVDLGCGQGRDAVWLAANGWNVIAVDHLPDAVERGQHLQERYAPGSSIQWEVGDIAEWLSYPADLIYLAYGPTHLLNPEDIVAPSCLVVGFSRAHHARHRKPNTADLVTPELAAAWSAEYGEVELADRLSAYLYRNLCTQ
jgi:SAM-dependent methyltransferase